MDNAGWHAQWRASRPEVDRFRGPDGQYQTMTEVVPMGHSAPRNYFSEISSLSLPPSPPPKDPLGDNGLLSQSLDNVLSSPTSLSNPWSKMTAVERSKVLKAASMNPPLQLMAGPLLRYDTIDEEGVWNGGVLLVTADSGSNYDPDPTLTYEWDSGCSSRRQRKRAPTVVSFDLGPHPADPYSSHIPAVMNGDADLGPDAQSKQVTGQEIWVYAGSGSTFTFWRFWIRIPLGSNEMRIRYNINHGQWFDFCVPGRNQNMRWATYSCNGFSAGINPDDFCGPGYMSGYDPVWIDLLSHHEEEPFHALVGGGDQLYCDGVSREPELQRWLSLSKSEQKIAYPLTDEIATAIDRFYFNHYCKTFRSGAFARANSSIPMVNMLDDHDIIDGFGSYPEDLQRAPVFRRIGSRGYFFFLLFQCFINVAVDGVDDQPGVHLNKSLIIGDNGPYVPFPSHSFLTYLGPRTYMLLLDCRAERKKNQVCSQLEYEKVFARLDTIPASVEHLIVQSGIPIAYPRLVFLERSLSSKFNPLVALGKSGSLGLSGFVNKFNSEAELLDDLNDHWCSDGHKKERNWLVEQLQVFSKVKHIRVTILSGDVHCAAVGVLKTHSKKHKPAPPPAADFRYMLNIVSSAIVNTPPPAAVISLVSTLATKGHKTMHYADTDESMLPLFAKDTDGSSRKHKYIMARRNWCCVKWDGGSGDLVFDIRVEKSKGVGKTIGYVVRVPPPQWKGIPG